MQRVYRATLDKTAGKPLGVVVSRHDDQTLLIQRVKGGLFHAWNQANPGLAVKPGDRILAVNSARGSAEELLKECERDAVLEMTIQRARVLVDLQPCYADADAAPEPKREGGSLSSGDDVAVARGGAGRSEADEAAGTSEGAEGAEGSASGAARPTSSTLGSAEGSHSEEDAVRALLLAGHVLLLRGSWLADLARRRGVLPRRQDLPPGAAWEPERLFPRAAEGKPWAHSSTEIAVVSYCWLTPEHPDPKGEQLRTLGRVVEEYLRHAKRDLAVFIDWCSLHQPPRQPEEQASFMQSLCHVGIWYAHQHTWKWMLTAVPEGWEVRSYGERGWPAFEWAVSQLAAVPERVLDLRRLELRSRGDDWNSIVAACALTSRQPPEAPDAFAKVLESKAFTHSVDRGLLEATYRRTFEDLVASAEVLDFSFLGWGDEEVRRLALALPLCGALRRLYLSWNRAGDAGAEALAAVLPRCGRLCKLGLAGNPITDRGQMLLREAWGRAEKPEEQLELW